MHRGSASVTLGRAQLPHCRHLGCAGGGQQGVQPRRWCRQTSGQFVPMNRHSPLYLQVRLSGLRAVSPGAASACGLHSWEIRRAGWVLIKSSSPGAPSPPQLGISPPRKEKPTSRPGGLLRVCDALVNSFRSFSKDTNRNAVSNSPQSIKHVVNDDLCHGVLGGFKKRRPDLDSPEHGPPATALSMGLLRTGP